MDLQNKFNPQFKINGTRNIWIVKPSGEFLSLFSLFIYYLLGLSRGRGIKCFDNLDKLLNHVVGE